MPRLFSWLTVHTYAVFLLIISILPPMALPKIDIIFFDKITHFLEYFLLAFIAINTSLVCRKKRPYLFSFSYAFGVGLIIEGIQLLLPYRSFEFSDILSNGVGCSLGLVLRAVRT